MTILFEKYILIIEPSTSGLELLPTAKKMGIAAIVLTANKDERIIPTVYQNTIYKTVVVDTDNLNELQNIAIQLSKQYKISAVIPGFEIYVHYASVIANLLGVPGVPISTGQALRDKYKMRTALKNENIKVPIFSLLDNIKKIENVAETVKFPCVIKPIDQSGSVHVSRANNLNELKKAYISMCADPWTEMSKGIGTVAIVEEFIEGSEYSVEGFVDHQGANVLSITEKKITDLPFFVEIGHVVEATISTKLRTIIINYIHDIIKALKINIGVFHAEIKVNNDNPILIEIAGRLAGDKICDLIQYAIGANMYEIMITSHLGNAIVNTHYNRRQYAGIRYFTSNLQTYSKVYGLDEIISLSGYRDFKILIQPKQNIPPLTNFLGRVAYCIFTADTYDKLQFNLNLAEQLIKFK